MAEESAFRGTLGFLADIGVFDVVLPFLLVFTIVFALLEKTRVFGTDKVGEKEYSKKQLNSLASFVIAFFVIASSRLVEIITEVSANIIILILAGVFFLMLAGSLSKQSQEGYFLENGKFKTLFMIIMFSGLAGIFLNAIKDDSGKSWLEWGLGWLRDFSNNTLVATVILLGLVVGVMFYIAGNGKHEEKKE